MEVIGIVGEGREDAWARTMQPPRLLMQRVHIPFTFKVQENAPIGYNVCPPSSSKKTDTPAVGILHEPFRAKSDPPITQNLFYLRI
ncbi:hypothetical protein SFRURICE_000435 [Spodoptera frugiperda]|nr:hypothetical protein SFRURICE_000435 [Spodoptera frugiperda]